MNEPERPIVCPMCREAMPDINWNEPCAHAKLSWEPNFVWRYGPLAWMKEPLPKGRYKFYQWQWSTLSSYTWMVFGRLAIRGW